MNREIYLLILEIVDYYRMLSGCERNETELIEQINSRITKCKIELLGLLKKQYENVQDI